MGITDGEIHELLQPNSRRSEELSKAIYDAYNMWLLRKGNDDEFSDWFDANEDKFNAFVDWYSDHIYDPVEVVK